MNTQKQIALMVALLFITTASCAAYTVIDLPVRATSQQEWHMSESIERGALLYANNCRTCHGIRGEGFVGPQLNKPEFQDQDPLVLSANHAMLTRTLQCGRAGTLMPAWLNTNGGSLNERQIEHIVNFLTAPSVENDEGELVNTGWEEAVHFAHNLNHETSLAVSGDTLPTIARQHDLGMTEMLELNPDIPDPSLFLEDGTIVTIPASAQAEQRTYEVRADRENLLRINEQLNVGTMILADLNQIPYEYDQRSGAFTIGAKEGVSEEGIGLYPGVELQLPDGSVYLLRAGDTLESVSAGHDASASEILELNRDLIESSDPEEEIPAITTIILPDTATYVVRDGDTMASIAEMHNMEEADLLAVNQNVVLQVGSAINLPPGTTYNVQPQDTLASISAGHGVTEDELAQANGLAPGTPIRPDVAIQLPPDPVYIVQGQSLDDIRQTLGGVTAESLGQAQDPPVPADHVYAVGTALIMPPDAYGSAPPEALNPGTACVEFTVPNSVFEGITGGGGDVPAAPEEVSTEVEIVSNATDWTVVADGESSAPNEGVVKVAPGTTITFRNETGVHTVTINEETVVAQADFPAGETYEQDFEEGGPFEITCDVHPDMLAWVFIDGEEAPAEDQ